MGSLLRTYTNTGSDAGSSRDLSRASTASSAGGHMLMQALRGGGGIGGGHASSQQLAQWQQQQAGGSSGGGMVSGGGGGMRQAAAPSLYEVQLRKPFGLMLLADAKRRACVIEVVEGYSAFE